MLERMLFAAAVLAFSSGAQAATTYDAFDSFDGLQGSGNFRYLKLQGMAPGVLLSTTGSCVVTSTHCLQDGTQLPGAYKSLTEFEEGTYLVPNDRLLVHPGPDSAIGVFFVAPVTGVYDYTASFNVLDDAPSGVAIVRVTNASGAPVSNILGGIGALAPALSDSGSLALDQGDVLAFIVNNAGSYSNDSTGVSFTLTTGAVPEPATWALMIMGFGSAGALLRRRRSAVAAG